MEAAALDRSLRTSHRTVLAVLAACALLSLLQEATDPEPAPDPLLTTVAVCLGLATVVARRASTSPVAAPRLRVSLILSSYAFAAGLGMLGTYLAMTQGAQRTGLAFALAAGIFCLRPPGPVVPPVADTPPAG